MYLPTSTYRVQLSDSFTLEQLANQLDYLHQLGISTVYASPIFEARAGSTHGYDVTNPQHINPEIGTEDELASIARRLREHGMGWLQDIVPNHMAYDTVNPWIDDLLEQGPHSAYAAYFDVDWEYPNPRFQGKIMAPFLGAPPEEVMAEQQLTLSLRENGFRFHYYDHRFPLSVRSYPELLRALVASDSVGDEGQKALTPWVDRIKQYVDQLASGQTPSESWTDIKTGLFAEVQQHESVRSAVQSFVEQYHRDTDQLTRLLDQQYFRLVHWQTTEREINYRRFFTVNDLICLNAQDSSVFEHYHRQLRAWIEQGYVQGVRVDHVDGLFDPTAYLEALRRLVGDKVYVAVEKILEHHETLPNTWPVQGSSGYDFLAEASQLFTSVEGGQSLVSYYPTWNPPSVDYDDLVYQNKSFILRERMRGELDNLMRQLADAELLPNTPPDQREALRTALGHILIAFPVYRIYSTSFPFAPEDEAVLHQAQERARTQAPELAAQFDTLQRIFSSQASDDAAYDERRLRFVMRCQQFAGPLAAKGVEDTTFYQYFPLVSHNEVGDSPERLGISRADFHRQMQQRSVHAMNATATHDTKRGEDARLRINLLSERPSEWMKETSRWRYATEPYRSGVDEHGGWPDANFEYFIYQTLVGTYPFHASPEEEDYAARLQAYLNKAAREAKVHTSWSEPNEAYERAIEHFVTQMLQDRDFMQDFTDFTRPLAQMAVTYSLGQTLLKATAPGIPDVYQGTEYWDLSMVDPDNRRPFSYRQRQDALRTLDTSEDTDRPGLLRRLTGNLFDPSIKLWVLSRSLRLRRAMPDLFGQGTYQPLEVTGTQAEHLLAFRRAWQQQEAIVLIPLGVAQLALTDQLPLGDHGWSDTRVVLPDSASSSWTNTFTQETITTDGHLSVSQALRDFPVAMLTNQL